VTGATGFLGRYVVRDLASSGFIVRAVGRSAPDPAMLCEGITIGSLSAATDWSAALDGVSAVVHLAARAHLPPREQEAQRDSYYETNVATTHRLAVAAAASGVRHFVFVSSVAVHGASTEGRAPLRETDMPVPRTIYGDTKLRAEQDLQRLDASGMAISIVRPPMIYGWPPRGSFRMLSHAIRRGVPLPLASIDNRRAFVAAENVASFIRHRLQGAASGCEPFIVADAEQVSTPEFARRTANAMGRPARLVPFPVGLLKWGLHLAGRGELVDSLVASLEVDITKAEATGWRPGVTLDEGLALAVQTAT
jgi:UDP-glucose 4-epimerase